MKIKEMFKKITAGIGVFLATVTSKVFAAFDLESHIAEPEYGIPTPSPKIPNTPFYVPLLNFLQIITIPIIIIPVSYTHLVFVRGIFCIYTC